MKIPLAQPDITNLERKEVLRVLKTPNLSLGPKLREFEQRIAKYIRVKYAVAVSSGTSGLHLIIKALGIKEGDEVITTPFSFIASSNCILYERAKPVFVDIEEETYNIDPQKIEEKITKKTKAILAVDVFGHPADWDTLNKLAKKHNLYLIEDSAEAFGSEYASLDISQRGKYKWKKCGSFGHVAILSFYPNKQITTGEGGIILTNNKKIADLCRSMTNQGRRVKSGKWLEHIRLGFNYRMSDINAALGIAQLKRLKQIFGKRKKVAQIYNKKLGSFLEIKIPSVAQNVKISWFVYVIMLSRKYSKKDRDLIIKEMAKKGIQCSTYFQSIHLQPFYRKMFNYKLGSFPISENVSQRSIALPFFNNLKEREINYVAKTLKKILWTIKK